MNVCNGHLAPVLRARDGPPDPVPVLHLAPGEQGRLEDDVGDLGAMHPVEPAPRCGQRLPLDDHRPAALGVLSN